MDTFRLLLGLENIHEASRNGNKNRVKAILVLRIDPNTRNENFETPLHLASHFGHLEVAQLLLDKGSKIDEEDKLGRTALFQATHNGHLDVVRLLLKNRANVNRADKYGGTPLCRASKMGQAVLVGLLLQKGARVNLENKYDGTPLTAASRFGHEDVVVLLLKYGASVNTVIEYGASVNTVIEYPFTPLREATVSGHFNVVKLLIEMGADVNCADFKGRTPLMEACAERNFNIIRLLLANDADIRAVDKDGQTAFEMGDYLVRELLTQHNREKARLAISESLEPFSTEEVNKEPSDKDISKLKDYVLELSEEVNIVQAKLDSFYIEKEKSDRQKMEDIEWLKLERSEILVRLNILSEIKTGASGKNISEIEDLDQSMAKLTETLTNRNQRIASLLDEKHSYALEMEAEMEMMKARLVDVITERDAELARLNGVISELENKVQELTNSNEELVSSVRGRDIEIERLRQQINQLKIEIKFSNTLAPIQVINYNAAPNAGQAIINVG